MSRKINRLLTRMTKKDSYWKFLKPFSNAGVLMSNVRSEYEFAELDLLSSLEVKNGPFKGMKYPSFDSVGSAIYPKLLGSYEQEIMHFIKGIKSANYSEIIDVGCAEGYYAVGLAMTIEGSKIYAYDTEEKARTLCQEMATLNAVSDKVTIRAKLTAKRLGEFNFTGKGLIICDCEGFEKKLFTKGVLENIKNCDLLIETHDFIDIEISTYLKDLLNETHDIEVVKSIDDIQKALHYDFDELSEFELETKREILAERRPAIMEWLICRSKSA